MNVWLIFDRFLVDVFINFGKVFGLPRFCVRFIMQRSPAVLPLCGLNALAKFPGTPTMYLNFRGYFTIAENALEKYSGKFKYALWPPLKPCA